VIRELRGVCRVPKLLHVAVLTPERPDLSMSARLDWLHARGYAIPISFVQASTTSALFDTERFPVETHFTFVQKSRNDGFQPFKLDHLPWRLGLLQRH